MNKCILTYRKERDKIIIQNSQERDKFLSELKEGEEFVSTWEKGVKFRTWLQNRYLHAILGAFIPDHFNSLTESKNFFCREALRHEDKFAIDDVERMRKVLSDAREILNFEYLEDGTMLVGWVKSTAKLTTKEMKDFIDHLLLRASELNIIIPEIKE